MSYSGFWQVSASISVPRRGLSGSGGRYSAVAVGGIGSDDSILSTVESFNGTSWSTLPSMSTPRCELAAAGSESGMIACGGEGTSGRLSGVEVFNGTSWSAGQNMSTARSYHGGDGTPSSMFVSGGSGSSGVLGSSELYDGTSWTTKGSLITAREMHVHGGNGVDAICIAGFNGENVLSGVEAYNGTSWFSHSNIMTPRQAAAGGRNTVGALVTAGDDLSGNVFASTELYSDAWISAGNLNVARFESAGKGAVGDGFVAGGAKWTGVMAHTEIFNPLYTCSSAMYLRRTMQGAFGSGMFLSFAERGTYRYKMTCGKLINRSGALSMGMLLIHSNKDQPVLDTIFKSWVRQLDNLQMKFIAVPLKHRLDYATGSEIDTKWGKIYNMPRRTGESDDAYRRRIKTYLIAQVGSGTKKSCRDVIDEVVGVPGSTRVDILYPGHVAVRWSDIYAARNAITRMDLLNHVMNSSLSAGITYTIYPEFADYTLNMRMIGPVLYRYISHMVLRRTIDVCTPGDMLIARRPVVEYASRVSNAIRRVSSYILDCILLGKYFRNISVDVLVGNVRDVNHVMDVIQKISNVVKVYHFELYLMKLLSMNVPLDLILKKGRQRGFLLDVILFNPVAIYGVWLTDVNLNTPRYLAAGDGNNWSAIATGGAGYSVEAMSSVEVYDGSVWVNAPPMIYTRVAHSSGGNGASAIACGGGGECLGYGRMDIFNGTTWTSGPDMLSGRLYHAGGGDESSALVCGGKDDSDNILSSTEVFNGTAWSSSGDMITSRFAHSGGGNAASALAADGATDELSECNLVEEFNGTVWSSFSNNITGRSYHGGRGLAGSAIIFGGNVNGVSINSTEIHNETGWVESTPLPSNLMSVMSGGDSDVAICAGGYDTNNPDDIRSTTYIYTMYHEADSE